MPTYAYVCTQCGHNFDAVQSFSDAPLTECPVCSGRLRKRFSPVGVVFKGSGFYRTDSRKSDEKSDKKPDKKESAAASSSGESTESASKGSSSTSASSSPAKAAS